MIVKICGIKTLKELEIVEKYADFGGVVVGTESKRRVSLAKAKEIIHSAKIPVFVVSTLKSEKEWQLLIEKTEASFVQIHSNAKPETVEAVRELGVKVMKAFKVPKKSRNPKKEAEKIGNEIELYNSDFILLDTGRGSGEQHDHRISRILAERFDVILAGGLTPENVGRVVNFVKPIGVDVSSGVEAYGEKNEILVKEFVKKARGGIC